MITPLDEDCGLSPALFAIAVRNNLRAILQKLQSAEEAWEETGFYKELVERRAELGQIPDDCGGLGEILFQCYKHQIRILGRRDAKQRVFFIYYCGLKDLKGERTNPGFYQEGCREAKQRESKERIHELANL